VRDTLRQRLWTVDAKGDKLQVSHVAWKGADHVASVTPDGKALQLLDIKRKRLAVARPGQAVDEYALPVPFGGLVNARDGKVAGLWHEDAGKAAGSIVNTSELALVDLQQKPGPAAVRAATVAGLAAAPSALRLSGEFDGPGGKHRLAWFEAPSAMGFADFGPGKVRTTVVPLVAPGSNAVVTVAKVELRTKPGAADLYIIANGSNDVVHLTLDLTQEALAVTLDQIASGPTPADVALIDTAQGPRALTVHMNTQLLALLDPATGAGVQVALDGIARNIVPFQGKDGKPKALLWTFGSDAVRVVDVDELGKKKGKAVQKLALESTVFGIHGADGGLFVVRHSNAFSGLSVVDPHAGKVSAFRNVGEVVDVVLRGATAWIAGRVQISGTTAIRLARVDLATVTGQSLEIGSSADAVHAFGDGVALTGKGLGGVAVTALPQGVLDTNAVRFAEGFTLEGVMP
jgi:hypothetical protein